jgi:type II secretory pathway component PulK
MRSSTGFPVRSVAGAAERRCGSILILTTWIIFLVAGIVLILGRAMRVEIAAAANQVAALQANAIERAAEAYALALVVTEKDAVFTLSDTTFAAVPVGEGYFWLLRPNYGDNAVSIVGIVDESSKIDVNRASQSTMQKLPGVTSDIAAAVVDWRDSNTEPETNGAEDQYYLALPEPYRTKNGPFETVEELLLVKGVTPELLFGRLGGAQVYAAAGMGGRSASVTTDQQLARGIYDYLTVYSNASGGGGGAGGGGGQTVDVNDENPQGTLRLLAEVLGESRAQELADKARPRPPFRDVFDFCLRLELTSADAELLLDRISTGREQGQQVKINVNTAPRDVLLTLPDLEESDVNALVAARASRSTTQPTSIAWVLDALQEKARGLGDDITGTASRYSAEILAVSGNGRAFRRSRIVIDAAATPPRILFRTDITDRGWPLDPGVLAELRGRAGTVSGIGGRGGMGSMGSRGGVY